MPHRQRGAALDAGGAVANDPVEFGAQFVDHLGDTLVGQRVLVAGLRCRQEIQILQALVADQRLRQFCDTVDDIDQVEHDAALGAQHQVEIAQADVEVDDDDLLAVLGKRCAQCSRRRGLADAAFAGCHDYDMSHF